MKTVASAFVKAQKAFAPALKSSLNPHFKSKYVALDACIEAVIDALNNNGIALMPPTHLDETGVTVETLFIHESGETLSGGKLHVPAAKHDPQGYGSALTYARRYSLMAACGIAPEDDDGNAGSKYQAPKVIKHAPVPEIELPEDRRIAVEGAVAEIVSCFDEGASIEGIGIWYSSAVFLDNDERTYAWKQLAPYSKIRSEIKSNKPTKEAA